MDSQHQHDQLVDELHTENRLLHAQMIAVRAVATMDEPDYEAGYRVAASALRRLLETPHQRPGIWESEHVTALADELRAVLAELGGGR